MSISLPGQQLGLGPRLRAVRAAARGLSLLLLASLAGCGAGDTTPTSTEGGGVAGARFGALARVTLSPRTGTLAVGVVQAMTATAYDNKDHAVALPVLAWSTAPGTGGRIDSTGHLTALAAGRLVVRVRANATGVGDRYAVEDSAILTVTPPPSGPAPLQRVELTPAIGAFTIGQTQQLTATAYDSTGAIIPSPALSWTTNAPAVATVSGSGLLTAIAPGQATITARAVDPGTTGGGVSGTATISVAAPAPVVARVTVTPASGSVAPGASLQLRAAALDASGAPVPGASVTWTSSVPAVATVSSLGVVTGVAAGATTVTALARTPAMPAGVSATAALSVPDPTGGVADTSWTYCTNDGDNCFNFGGFRTLRFGRPGGPYLYADAHDLLWCYARSFNTSDWTTTGRQCWFSAPKTLTLTNPSPMSPLTGATVAVPVGNPGSATADLEPSQITATSPPDGDFGAFRTTCWFARAAFDDPIVYPGQPGRSHLHLFFGNTAIDANTTPQSLLSTGASTCRGGTANRTAYWMPAVVDGSGAVLAPLFATIYYKTGYSFDPTKTAVLPTGLRMIAGDKTNTSTAVQQFWNWECGGSSGTGIPAGCAAGSTLRFTIIFPQCWDGVNLDAPDHKSHMAYPLYRNPPAFSTCPSTHPVQLPEITEHFDFPVRVTGETAHWRLSSDMYGTSLPGGLSAHADWMMGWDPAVIRAIVTQCLNRGRDCQVGSIGDGRELF